VEERIGIEALNIIQERIDELNRIIRMTSDLRWSPWERMDELESIKRKIEKRIKEINHQNI